MRKKLSRIKYSKLTYSIAETNEWGLPCASVKVEQIHQEIRGRSRSRIDKKMPINVHSNHSTLIETQEEEGAKGNK